MSYRHATQWRRARTPAPRARPWDSCGELTGRENPVLLEQRADVGSPATKVNEGFQRIAAAASGEDGSEEAARGLTVEYAVLLEGGECVGREHLGPLVAVVTGCVATGEDVPEAVGEAVPLGNGGDRDLTAQ